MALNDHHFGFEQRKQQLRLWLKQSIQLPLWLRSSAAQQGIFFVLVSILSLVLMASASLMYVDYELGKQNQEIVRESKELASGHEKKIDDDPIEDDEILAVLTTGFILSGVLVAIFTTAIVIALSRHSRRRISRIEQVLAAAAEGDLSVRTGVKRPNNDLARIAVSVDEMLSRLEGSVAAMSDISSNIAHELKTPITRLRHNLLALREDASHSQYNESQAFMAELDQALNDSQRLASIFDALLRISQIESGARRSRFSPVDVGQIVDTVAEIYSDVAEDAGMHLEVEKPAQALMIQGDRELLIQQVANLIENALRYCAPTDASSNTSNNVLSHAENRTHIRLSCGLNAVRHQVWLQVEDNGPGIADGEKARVFERLYRVDKSRTDGGLGLGLSLAKAVAGLHHGHIHLYDCDPGLGVRIEMPNRMH